MRGRRAGVVAALAVVAAAALTAGCGGGGSHALAFDPVAAAATKTQNAGAARIRFSTAFSSSRLQGRLLRISGTGAIDGTTGELSFDMGSMLKQLGLPSGVASSAKMQQLMHSSIKEIFLKEGGDFVIYMRLGFLASQIPGGKQWLKLDLSKVGKSAGVDFNQLLSGSEVQPTDLLAMLKTEGAEIRKVGPATVDGAATTQYHVTVDVAKALKSRGLSSPMLAGIASQIPNVPEDVWIGKDGLVHRIRLALGMALQGKSMHLAMQMDLYDYGAHVTVAAPPASQVFDATQLAQSGIGTAFGSFRS